MEGTPGKKMFFYFAIFMFLLLFFMIACLKSYHVQKSKGQQDKKSYIVYKVSNSELWGLNQK